MARDRRRDTQEKKEHKRRAGGPGNEGRKPKEGR